MSGQTAVVVAVVMVSGRLWFVVVVGVAAVAVAVKKKQLDGYE